jgi:hypothetical protein
MGRLAVLAVAVIATTNLAYAYCAVPDAPSCATRYGAFDDQDDFERCRRRMTTFRDELESHLQCVRDEYNQAVERFNRRARG